MLNNFAWFTSNQMMATGNMKKGTDALKIKKDLYRSLEDLEEEQTKDKDQGKKDVESEKAKLIQRFGIGKT